MNTEKSEQTERGQVMVIMIFGIIVLLLVAGLAIDGGTVFAERRHAQNAADASSLAGTRALAEAVCGTAGVTDPEIYAEVIRFATENDVNDPVNNVLAHYVDKDMTELGVVGGGSIPTGATGVSAKVDIKRQTFLMPLIGIDSSTVSAEAVAMTGPPLVAGGMRPFGVPQEIVSALDPDDPSLNWFTVNFKNDGMTWATGQMQHRGWMNMDYVWNAGEQSSGFPRAIDESANAAVIKDWMVNGWTGSIYPDAYWAAGARAGDYIHAKPGTNSSAVCQAPMNMSFPIPIYDHVPDCATEIPSGVPRPSCPTQGSGYVYHIIGIGTVQITGCSQGGGEIDLVLKKVVWGEGMPSIGSETGYGEANACATYTQAVTLWE